MHAAFADVKVSDRSLIWNSDLIETLELQNLLGQALVTMGNQNLGVGTPGQQHDWGKLLDAANIVGSRDEEQTICLDLGNRSRRRRQQNHCREVLVY